MAAQETKTKTMYRIVATHENARHSMTGNIPDRETANRMLAAYRAIPDTDSTYEIETQWESMQSVTVTWYARLTGPGRLTRDVYAVLSMERGIQYDDNNEPYYAAYTFGHPYGADDGNEDIVETIVYFDYLYRRCARISADDARTLSPILYAHGMCLSS